MRRFLINLLLAGMIVLSPVLAWAGTWEDVCAQVHVRPDQVSKPEIILVDKDNPIVKDLLAAYFPSLNVIVTTTYDEYVIAHEFAHAIMCSTFYQERGAEAVEPYYSHTKRYRP